MSQAGVPIETIADQLGHDGTRMTLVVYRHQTKPSVTAAHHLTDLLHRTLHHMGTTWTEPDQPGTPEGLLPRTLRGWALDDTFTASMAASARRVAHHLTLTEDDRSVADATTCTADEINIAIAIRFLLRYGARPNGPDPVLDELIDHNATSDPDTDHGYDLTTALELARDELVDDIDIDHLWNPALDGIENDTALQHHWRMTTSTPPPGSTASDQPGERRSAIHVLGELPDRRDSVGE